jgi:hypothetical protein
MFHIIFLGVVIFALILDTGTALYKGLRADAHADTHVDMP